MYIVYHYLKKNYSFEGVDHVETKIHIIEYSPRELSEMYSPHPFC